MYLDVQDKSWTPDEFVKLGPLTENEARELLKHTPQPFAEADVEWILENSGRWPALLQIWCDVRLQALKEEEQGEGWKNEGLARIKPYQCEYRYKNEN